MKNSKGFTLIEVTVSLVILGLVLGAVSSFMISLLDTWKKGNDQMEVVDNLRISMDYLVRDIRKANTIKPVPSTSSWMEITIPGDGTTTIVHYKYDATDQELERSIDGDPFQPVSSQIKSITFKRSEASNKLVDITLVGIRSDGHEITMNSKVFAISLP